MTNKFNKKFTSIQISRGIAAVMVVMSHGYLFFGPSPFTNFFSPGISGVDFFFVLSGFIIFYIHYGDIGTPAKLGPFVRKRVVRVFPIYWIYTFLYLAVDQFIVQVLNGKTLLPFYHGLLDVVSSVTLIPPNRLLEESPIIPPAWSLAHEIFFYALFGLAIIVGKHFSLVIAGCWVLLILMSTAGRFSEMPYWISEFCFSPLNLEFLLGSIVGYLVVFKSKNLKQTGPWILGCGVIAIFICWILSMSGKLESPGLRVLSFGPAYSLTILGLVLTEQHILNSWSDKPIFRILSELGDSSYSIYLVHFLPLFIISIAFSKIGLSEVLGISIATILACMLVIVLGWLGFRVLERPLLRVLR